jgi:hypothetical protein
MIVPGRNLQRREESSQSSSRREGTGSSAFAFSTMVASGSSREESNGEEVRRDASNVGSSSGVRARAPVRGGVDNVFYTSNQDDQKDEGDEQEIGRGRLNSSMKSATKRTRGRGDDDDYDLDGDDYDRDDSDQSDNRGRTASGGRNSRGGSAKKGGGRNSRAEKETEAAMTKATARQVEEDRRAEKNSDFKLSYGCIIEDCKDLEDTKFYAERVKGMCRLGVAIPDVSLNQYHIQI